MRAKEWYERMNDEYIGGMKGTSGVMFDYAVIIVVWMVTSF